MESLKKSKWKTADKRFIAFLDIMGFKDFVARNPHKKIYDMMMELSNSRNSITNFFSDNEKYKDCIYSTSFSDSIVLFSKDESIDSFEAITIATSLLMADAITSSIPIKGAIAHGLLSVNKSEQIYFGQPLIDAYLLQEDVNYYGVICHNSVDKYIHEISEIGNIIDSSYKEIKTPLKSGSINHRNLDWFNYMADFKDGRLVTKRKFDDSIKKLNSNTSGAPRKYIDNTILVYECMFPDITE